MPNQRCVQVTVLGLPLLLLKDINTEVLQKRISSPKYSQISCTHYCNITIKYVSTTTVLLQNFVSQPMLLTPFPWY